MSLRPMRRRANRRLIKMNMLNKWTVGLGLLIAGIAIFAIGATGTFSVIQFMIGAVLGVVGALVLIKA